MRNDRCAHNVMHRHAMQKRSLGHRIGTTRIYASGDAMAATLAMVGDTLLAMDGAHGPVEAWRCMGRCYLNRNNAP